MDKVSSLLVYLLFLILPWKSALPGLLGEVVASSIDKVLVILLLISTSKYWGNRLLKNVDFKTVILLQYFVLVVLILFIHADFNRAVLQVSDYVIPFLMVFIGMVVFKDNSQFEKFFKVLIFYSAFIAIFGTAELFIEPYREWANAIAVREVPNTSLEGVYNRFRARFFFPSFMSFGVYCGIMLLFSLDKYRNRGDTNGKLYLFSSFFLLLGLLASFSRGPWVMFAISLGCYYIISIYKSEISFSSILKSLIVTVSILVLLLISVDGLFELMIERLLSIFNWSDDNSNLTRINKWNESLAFFYQNPISGLGLSSTGVGETEGGKKIITESYYLKLAIEGGISLLLYFVILQITILANLFNNLKAVKTGLLLSIFTGLYIYMFIYQILEDRVIAYLYWFLVGISFASVKKSNGKYLVLKIR